MILTPGRLGCTQILLPKCRVSCPSPACPPPPASRRAFQQAKATIDRREESEREKERREKEAEEAKKRKIKEMFDRL